MVAQVITATPRQLESSVRLAEALAKMRLSPTVEREDVMEGFRLMKVQSYPGLTRQGAVQQQVEQEFMYNSTASVLQGILGLPVDLMCELQPKHRSLPAKASGAEQLDGRCKRRWRCKVRPWTRRPGRSTWT